MCLNFGSKFLSRHAQHLLGAAHIASEFTCVFCTAAGTIFGTTGVYELDFSYLSISIFNFGFSIQGRTSFSFLDSRPIFVTFNLGSFSFTFLQNVHLLPTFYNIKNVNVIFAFGCVHLLIAFSQGRL